MHFAVLDCCFNSSLTVMKIEALFCSFFDVENVANFEVARLEQSFAPEPDFRLKNSYLICI